MAGRPVARSDGGFTLVEILVVLAILATLIGLVAAIVPAAMRKKEIFRGQTIVRNVGAELDRLKYDQDEYGKYPPTRLRDLRLGKSQVGKEVGQANDVNVGGESVYFLLNNPEVKANQVTSDPDLVGNTDDDAYRVARGNAPDTFAREYLDPWGMPLVYFHSNDYKEATARRHTYKSAEATVEVGPKKLPSKLGGGYLNPNSFQLFSLGPNGEQDPDDAEEPDDIWYEGK